MLSRRDLVEKLAAGTAAVWVLSLARTGFASGRHAADTGAGSGPGEGRGAAANGPETRALLPQVVDAGPAATLSEPPPWDLLRPLTLGSGVGQGWRVAGFTGAVDGSCVLTLQNEKGRAHRVHLCRNDGQPQGLVYTKRFDLVVMNGGQGDLPTEESLAQAVAEVAHVVATNEGGGQHERLAAAVLPQAERVRQFAGPADRRLR